MHSWIRNLIDHLTTSRQSKMPRRRNRPSPPVEALETRLVLSAITVTTTADTTGGANTSLRDAIVEANTLGGAQTINFASGVTGTISLVSGELPIITGNITIDGPGAGSLVLDAHDASRVFEIGGGGTADLVGLTIENGSVADASGGGILNAGTLTIDQSTLTSNISNGSVSLGGGDGGAIDNSGSLTVIASTLSNNAAQLNGGGIENSGTLKVTNSTISGNSAIVDGGGIDSTGTATLSYSTVVGNTAAAGNDVSNNGGTLLLTNTIAGQFNYIGSGTAIDSTSVHNLFVSGGAGVPTNGTNGDVVVATTSALHLGALANNGGPTPTIVPLAGSPAIGNALYLSSITTDQRGSPRTSSPDVGAYEILPSGPSVNSVSVDGGSTSVSTGEVLTSSVNSFSVSFSENLNALSGVGGSVINLSNWALYENGADVSNLITGITFGFGSAANPFVATVTLSQPLTDGSYQLVARHSIQDLAGQSLIGNANGSVATEYRLNFYVGHTVTVSGNPESVVDPILTEIEPTPLSAIGPLSTPVTSTLQTFDLDSSTWIGATIKISGNYQNGQDVLRFTNTATITGTWDASTGTLTLSGTDSVSNYRAALQSVAYHNSSATPITSLTRTVSFQASDGLSSSNTVSRDLTVRANSNPPVVSGAGGTTNYAARSAAVIIAPNLITSDVDNVPIASATVTFANWQDGDRVDFANPFAFQHTFVEDLTTHTATLTMTGNDTAADYQAALRTVEFWSVNSNPNTTTVTATFAVTDILSNVASQQQSLSVTPVNAPPLLSGIETTPLVYQVNHPEIAPPTISSSLSVTDPDSNDLNRAVVQITAGYQSDANGQDILSFKNQNGITGIFNVATGTMVLSGASSVSNYRAALDSVTFSSSGSSVSTATRTLTITVTDNTSLVSNSITRNVAWSTTNASPVLSAGSSTVTFSARGTQQLIAPNLVVADSDSATLASATVSFTNWQDGDRLAFLNTVGLQHTFVENLTTNTASLTISGSGTPTEYQTFLRTVAFYSAAGDPPVVTRVASIKVNDGFTNSNSVTTNVAVIAVNAAPILSGIETTPLVYNANHPEDAPLTISSTLSVTDADSTNLTQATVQITSGYQNTSTDKDLLSFTNQNGITGSFDATTGTLTLTGSSYAGNYRDALDSVVFSSSGTTISTVARTFTITVVDPTSLSSNSVTRNITIGTTTNAAPTLAGGTTTVAYTQNGAAQSIGANLIVTDSDSATLASATVSFTNWQNGDRLSFDNTVALQHSFVENLTSNTATLTISGAGTPASYQAFLRTIQFYSVASSPPTTTRVASITVNDGLSNSNTVTTNVTFALTGSGSITAPTVTSQSASIATPTITGTFDSTNGPQLSVTVGATTYTLGTSSQLTSPSAGKWSLNLTGAPLTSQTTTVTAKSSNQQGQSATGTGTVTDEQSIIHTYLTANNLTATTTASGLNYVITTRGTGAIPTSGQKVTVNYSGFLLNSDGTKGTEFDSNIDAQFSHVSPFSFTLGQGQVIAGWDEAFALLPVGTIAQLIIPSAIAYGTTGSGSSIPANSILIFNVTVVSAS